MRNGNNQLEIIIIFSKIRGFSTTHHTVSTRFEFDLIIKSYPIALSIVKAIRLEYFIINYYLFSDAHHLEGVVVLTSKSAYSIGNRKF